MPCIISAGLQCLSTDYLLVIVRHSWLCFQLVAMHRGTLEQISVYAQQLPVAIAIDDQAVTHWLEEFPRHLSKTAMLAYIQRSKADLLSDPRQHLTTVVHRSTHLQHMHCWLLHQSAFLQECHAYLKVGLHIRAVEPLSHLSQRGGLPYRDPQRLMDRVTAFDDPLIHQTLKLACRHQWATEDWLC